VPSASTTDSAQALASGEPAFDTWRAVVKTVTYRVMVTTIDFGANYVEIGELVTTLALSSLALVDGPIPHFATSGLGTITAPPRGGEQGNGWTAFASFKVSRALAKTVTYEVVTAVSEFGANYLFVPDVVAAAGSPPSAS
jgi:uncharacterized membrane protein